MVSGLVDIVTRWGTRGGAGRRGKAYGGECKRVHFDTEGGNVFLLKLASQVALDEGGLSGLNALAMKFR